MIVLDPEVEYTERQLEIYDELEQLYRQLTQLHHSQQEWNAASTNKRLQGLDIRIARLEALRDEANVEANKQRFQERIDGLQAKRDSWSSQEWQDKIAGFGQQIADLNQRKDELETLFNEE